MTPATATSVRRYGSAVKSVEIELVWEPYWTPEKMDPRVRAFLG